MKKVVVRRLKDGIVIEEVFTGVSIGWSFDPSIFRVWDAVRTLAVPYQMIESVEIIVPKS